ncbi:uncharacterized protein LOC109539772 [Dendroctonus ponderosae]|uniref:uncharacterized protein LOC109539772 n=1 Tax=Dendroctonus ponderosae TaxID=77166 RepID=UPI0020359C89|nr:uncharacterized protein LOC109539772 [Dendroctonus ponderosae]
MLVLYLRIFRKPGPRRESIMDLKVILIGFLCCVVMAQTEEGIENGKQASNPQAEDDSDMYMESVEPDHKVAASSFETGEWFPSFSSSYDPYGHPTSGHSRPVFHDIYHQQEGAYSQRNDPPAQQDLAYNHPKANGYKPYVRQQQQEVKAEAQPQQQVKENAASILGDGNFGVIQGGTFYPEKDGYDSELGGAGFDDFSSYFHNGHGRPSYYYPSNSKTKAKKQQQFENFRDFADINNPPQRQYSQYVVVYTNKNGTRTTVPSVEEQGDYEDAQLEAQGADKNLPIEIDAKRPKNILESLALLDQTEPSEDDPDTDDENGMILTLLPAFDQGDIIEIPPEKKQSKSKSKLAKLLPEKKHESRQVQKAKDMKEPLLALS